MPVRFLILLFYFIPCLCPLIAGKLNYSQRITISNGLAHNGVTSVFEDSRGFFWIGTFDGLSRYDGYECKVIKNTLEKQVFASNRIRSIAEDTRHNLLIGSDEGISVYNYEKESYATVYSQKDYCQDVGALIVRKILVNENDGSFVAITEQCGAFFFDRDYTLVKHYAYPLPHSIYVDGLSLDEDNYLFLSKNNGFYYLNVEDAEFKIILPEQLRSTKGLVAVNDTSFIASANCATGLVSFKKVENRYFFDFKPFKSKKLLFRSATIDCEGNLWLLSPHHEVIKVDNVQQLIKHKPVQKHRFRTRPSMLRLSSIYASKTHGIWMGTFNDGLFRFKDKENPFLSCNSGMNYKHGIQSDEVTYISPIDDDRLYVSTTLGGVKLFDTKKRAFEPLDIDLPSNLQQLGGVIFKDSRGVVWLRPNRRVEVLRMEKDEKGQQKTSTYEMSELFSPSIRFIKEDKAGDIWIGNKESVLKLILDKEGEIERVESLNDHPYIQDHPFRDLRCFYIDPTYNFIWLGTQQEGLYRISINESLPIRNYKVVQYLKDSNADHSMSSNFVSSIVRLPNNEFWLGTEQGGIMKVLNSREIPSFFPLSEKNGLSNNTVKSILYDDDDNLWISTNNGLNKFNTKDSVFQTFGKHDGLSFENFTYPAETLKNGQFVFSGFNGFMYFNPQEIDSKEPIPKLIFGDVKIRNDKILPGNIVKDRVVLHQRLQSGDTIKLKFDENIFSIEALSLHYSSSDNHYLEYRLLPNDHEWIRNKSNHNYIEFNGLNPGKYLLQVRASNSQNEWSDPLSLNIFVSPPFWETSFFIILVSLLMASIIYVVVIIILRMKDLKNKVKVEHLEMHHVKELNKAKLRFFSNISHEIKTPITLIKGPVEQLITQYKGEPVTKEMLALIRRQSQKISRLVDQVHDFQKAESNSLEMNTKNFYLDELIDEIVEDFRFLEEHEGKYLDLVDCDQRYHISADRDNLEKIINNLLSNAFKFTQSDDRISISCRTEGEELIIEIHDTGSGIAPHDLPHIFERFYHSKNKHHNYTRGTGIGLAFTQKLVEMHHGSIEATSDLGVGTKMIVRMPIVITEESAKVLKEEELILELEKRSDVSVSIDPTVKSALFTVDKSLADTHIYWVEDNVDMRLFVAELLSKHFKVTAFSDGAQCLSAMDNEWPDLVLSDILMPSVNGLELCKAIKTNIQTSHIPIILLTACTTTNEQIKGIQVGADAYINKPFDEQQLLTRIEALLTNRRILRERFRINMPLTKSNDVEKSNDDLFLKKLYQLIEVNMSNTEIEIESFCKELCLNRTLFYKKVKALTNKTPFELIKEYRLTKAAELLLETGITVNEVFLRTGFRSRTHFAQTFKKYYGCTPGSYAKTKKESSAD